MPKSDPNDVLLVKNIDFDCSEEVEEPRKRSRVVTNQFGQAMTIEEDFVDRFNHKDFFQVRWAGQPYRITPGETRKMLRFVAENYGKHLADHILQLEERKTGKTGLINSVTRRPQVLAQILVGVDTYFLGDSNMDEGERVAAQHEILNPEEEAKAINLGEVPNPAVGVLRPEPKSREEIMKAADEASEEKSEETPKLEAPVTPSKTSKNGQTTNEPVETSIFDPDKPRPTRKELLQSAVDQGIEVSGRETVDQLIGMLKSF